MPNKIYILKQFDKDRNFYPNKNIGTLKMNTKISTEKQLQNNTINLLKSMGYIFISPKL